MKKRFLTVAIIATIGVSLVSTSCIGSFQLSNKLLTWNKSVGNKFVNELVFFAFWVLPVYEVSVLADVLVLNTIEFWSGSNPVAQGKTVIDGKDGKYLVECDGKGYTITSQNDKSVVRLDFDADSREWSTVLDGQRVVFMTFVDDNHVKLPTPSGDYKIVETNQQGLYAYQQAILADDLAAR